LILHVISRLKPQLANLMINANRHLTDYANFGYPVWPDNGFSPDGDPTASIAEFKGPLAGVETGLTHCTTPYLLTVPCDTPFLPLDLADRLMTALRKQNADIAVACTGNPEQPRLQPVFCLISISLLGQLQQYLNAGGRRMDGWYGTSSVAKVYFADESEFRNINTLDELHACSAHHSER
jgi:molybdenum cofactor guanylyltransferase